MPGMLQGQVAVIFGATGQVGPSVCRLLSQQGAAVVVHYNRSSGKADEMVREIEAGGGQAMALQADVSDEGAVRAAYDAVMAKWGRVDIVVNHVYRDREYQPTRVYDMQWEDWDIHLEALKSHFLICKHALPIMRAQKYGRIIYISGGLAFRFYKGLSAFTTMKAGINGFCKTLALEEGENNITVNIVSPGKVVGEVTHEQNEAWNGLDNVSNCPLGRFAGPQDVANGVLVFAIPGSCHLTGQTLYVSGGEIMPMP